MARQTDMDFFDELLTRSKRWLDPSGNLQVILPPALADVIEHKAGEHGLGVRSTVKIRYFVSHISIRRIILLRAEELQSELQSLMRISYAALSFKQKNNQT